MDADAMSSDSDAKSLNTKASVHGDTQLMPQRIHVNTHAHIQGLTAALLVGGRACGQQAGGSVWLGAALQPLTPTHKHPLLHTSVTTATAAPLDCRLACWPCRCTTSPATS